MFGSSKDLSCLFWRTDGIGERYTGPSKYGVDLGFTKEAQMVWLVFAPGNIGPGALPATTSERRPRPPSAWAPAPMSWWAAAAAVTLQPVSVEGSVGLNVAAGIGEVELRKAP